MLHKLLHPAAHMWEAGLLSLSSLSPLPTTFDKVRMGLPPLPMGTTMTGCQGRGWTTTARRTVPSWKPPTWALLLPLSPQCDVRRARLCQEGGRGDYDRRLSVVGRAAVKGTLRRGKSYLATLLQSHTLCQIPDCHSHEPRHQYPPNERHKHHLSPLWRWSCREGQGWRILSAWFSGGFLLLCLLGSWHLTNKRLWRHLQKSAKNYNLTDAPRRAWHLKYFKIGKLRLVILFDLLFAFFSWVVKRGDIVLFEHV